MKPKTASPAVEMSTIVPLTYDASTRRFRVPVSIDGRKFQMFLDTGMLPGISVDKRTAESLRLYGKSHQELLGVQGQDKAVSSVVHSVTVGGIQFRHANVFIVPTLKKLLPSSEPVLGPAMFTHYRMALDFSRKTMTLTPRSMPGITPSGPMTVSVPFQQVGGKVMLPVHILGQSGLAMLDSGSDSNYLSGDLGTAASALLKTADLKRRSFSDQVAIGTTARSITVTAFRVPVPITIDTSAESLPLVTTSQVSGGYSGENLPILALLGAPFLLQFQRVTIDYAANVLTFEYPETGKERFGYERSLDKFFPGTKLTAFPGYEWKKIGQCWVELSPAQVIGCEAQAVALKDTSTKRAINSVVFNGTEIGIPSGIVLTEKANGSIYLRPYRVTDQFQPGSMGKRGPIRPAARPLFILTARLRLSPRTERIC